MTWNTYTAQGQLKQLSAASPLAPMIPISDTVLGTTQASITVNLPSTYQHAQIWVSARSDTAAINSPLRIRFNGDSATNYDNQAMYAQGATITAAESLATASPEIGFLAAASDAAGKWGQSFIDIADYTSTTQEKMATAKGSWVEANATSQVRQGLWTTHWRSTAAITSVTLFPGSGNFIAGSRVTVYGMGVTTPNAIGVGAFTPPTYGTTLPASPADGQQAIYVDSTTSPTYQWLFRYNAGSSQTDKWEFVGGLPWTNYTSASASLTFTTPLAGVWKVHSGGDACVSSGGDASVTPYGGASSGGGNNGPQTAWAAVTSARLAASTAVTVNRAGTTGPAGQLSLSVFPIRVS